MRAIILAGMLIAGSAIAADRETAVSLSADAASAYVFRGETFNDGLVLQPGLEIRGLLLTFGIWGNMDIDNYSRTLKGLEFSEIDIYASYETPVKGVSLGYCEYTYPGTDSAADREISIAYEASVFLNPYLSINYGIDGGLKKSLYVEAGVLWEEKISDDTAFTASVSSGYRNPDEGESGFSHYLVSVSITYKVFTFSLNYAGQIDDTVLPDIEDGGRYDTGLYGVAGLSADF